MTAEKAITRRCDMFDKNSRRVGGSFVTFDLLASQRGCAGEQQAVLELGFLKQSIDVSALVDNSYIQGL